MDATKQTAMLAKPLRESEIEWRIGMVTKDGTKASLLAYTTSRGVMRRLTEVFGHMWSTEITQIEGGFKCRITVTYLDGFVRHVEDVSQNSDIEALKGGASGALKRAAVHLGIGRYLYQLPNNWVPLLTIRPNGKHIFHKGKFAEVPQLPPRFKIPEEK